MSLLKTVEKHAPTIFSVLASAGVVATFILTARKAEKVEEDIHELEEPTTMDEVKVCARHYAPAIGVGIATIVCIIFANHLGKKQQASLAAAYMLSHKQYERYKDKLKELYGEEAHQRIIEALAAETADIPDIYASGIYSVSNRKLGGSNEKILFYDRFGDRYFESTIEAVMDAEYHLNRNYVLRGYVTLNEFYIFLGLEETEDGDKIGWDAGNEHDYLFWLDFNHYIINVGVLDDETPDVECVCIDVPFEPCYLEAEYHLK